MKKGWISVAILSFLLVGCLGSDDRRQGSSYASPPVSLMKANPDTSSSVEVVSYDLTNKSVTPGGGGGALALKDNKIPGYCRIQDRFDRSETVAYQWGNNRLGMRVASGFDGAFVRYRLKFQSHKTKKEKCKNASAWQGLVPTGYHELVVRENDTVWDELNLIENDVRSRFDTLLQN